MRLPFREVMCGVATTSVFYGDSLVTLQGGEKGPFDAWHRMVLKLLFFSRHPSGESGSDGLSN